MAGKSSTKISKMIQPSNQSLMRSQVQDNPILWRTSCLKVMKPIEAPKLSSISTSVRKSKWSRSLQILGTSWTRRRKRKDLMNSLTLMIVDQNSLISSTEQAQPLVRTFLLKSSDDKNIFVNRTWFQDFFQTYLNKFISYAMTREKLTQEDLLNLQ